MSWMNILKKDSGFESWWNKNSKLAIQMETRFGEKRHYKKEYTHEDFIDAWETVETFKNHVKSIYDYLEKEWNDVFKRYNDLKSRWRGSWGMPSEMQIKRLKKEDFEVESLLLMWQLETDSSLLDRLEKAKQYLDEDEKTVLRWEKTEEEKTEKPKSKTRVKPARGRRRGGTR